jgi:hypothetical protein
MFKNNAQNTGLRRFCDRADAECGKNYYKQKRTRMRRVRFLFDRNVHICSDVLNNIV